MKRNNNPLYLVVLFVATTGLGVVLGKCLQPAPVEYSEEITTDSISEEDITLSDSNFEEETTEEENTSTVSVKEVDKKPEKPAEPVMTPEEFKQNVRKGVGALDTHYFHGNAYPTFKLTNPRDGDNRLLDIQDLKMKMGSNTENHWKDYEVRLDYDNKGKIKEVYITAVYDD